MKELMNLREKEIDKFLNDVNNKIDRLYPEPGNGHGKGLGITHWRDKPVIPADKWKEISGLEEIETREKEIEIEIRSNPETEESRRFLGEYPDWAWDQLQKIKYELSPEALNYFPDELDNDILNVIKALFILSL
jgi:hypothetical protein